MSTKLPNGVANCPGNLLDNSFLQDLLGYHHYPLKQRIPMQNGMKLRHPCLIVLTHETSSTVRGEIAQHIVTTTFMLIAVTHEKPSTLRGATYWMQNAM